MGGLRGWCAVHFVVPELGEFEFEFEFEGVLDVAGTESMVATLAG